MQTSSQFELTSELRGSNFVEGERNRVRARGTLRRNGQPRSTPAGGNNAMSRIIGRKQRSITPRQIDGTGLRPCIFVKLFGKLSVLGRILGNDSNEAVCKALNGTDESAEGG